MRNLDRGYQRIGLVLGPLITWTLANMPNPDYGGHTLIEHHGGIDWEGWVAMSIFAVICAVVIAVITWAILWVPTGLGIWIKRGFEDGR